jgi:hypothetical protein
LSLSEPALASRGARWGVIAECRDSKFSQIGDPIEIGENNLLHLDAEAIVKPLGGEISMAPFAAVAQGRPT